MTSSTLPLKGQSPSSEEPVADAIGASLPSVTTVMHFGVFILGLKIALRAVGFGKTIRWLRRHAESVPIRPHHATAQLTWAMEGVAAAAALYPGRALCLEQSLTLYYVLRRAGVPAAFRFGAQAHPIIAHAWVEYGGEPLNDFVEHTRQYAPFPDSAL